jgi:hypothetical protein
MPKWSDHARKNWTRVDHRGRVLTGRRPAWRLFRVHAASPTVIVSAAAGQLQVSGQSPLPERIMRMDRRTERVLVRGQC